ncbi:MAG TPA: metallophosphoesterase [Longimicrobiaceae bacterium]|nr:metallophosphoesterase [Longimicrobiaceae bacterium]
MERDAGRISRRRFLGALGLGVAAAGAGATVLETRRVTVTRHVLGAAEPASGVPPLRIVQLADLHLGELDGHAERVAEVVTELRPRVVVFTGDSVDRLDTAGVLEGFLRLLPPVDAAFATLGNWEHLSPEQPEELRRAYGRHGVRLLVNESAALEHGGRRVLVTGVDDLRGSPSIHGALRGVDPAANHLLLAHSPAYRDALVGMGAGPRPVGPRWEEPLERFRVTAMLAGHTHGGQVAPFGFAPVRPRGSGRYVAGWYRDARPHLYVSRGIGTSIVPVRLGAPPEIAVFDWHLAG